VADVKTHKMLVNGEFVDASDGNTQAITSLSGHLVHLRS